MSYDTIYVFSEEFERTNISSIGVIYLHIGTLKMRLHQFAMIKKAYIFEDFIIQKLYFIRQQQGSSSCASTDQLQGLQVIEAKITVDFELEKIAQ